MDIEKEVFGRCSIVFEKLLSYGFVKKDHYYFYSENILENTFRIDIEVSFLGMVHGKIYDLSFDEEYTNYRMEHATGEFVQKVRREFENLLYDIKDKCTIKNHFMNPQANRIASLIESKYHDIPEFIWDKFPGYGIFRNPHSELWYALIMNIQRSKIDVGDEEIEVINLKLEEKDIPDLLQRKGFYPAYHMSKKNWITILLDDTITDEELCKYIEISHQFTEEIHEWLVPANPKYYDVIHCFDETNEVLWKQSSNIHVGDIVYLYVAAPYSAILYQCEVLEINIPYTYQDKNLKMSKVMKLKRLKSYDEHQYTFSFLNQYGIQSIRGPRKIDKRLSKVINQKQ